MTDHVDIKVVSVYLFEQHVVKITDIQNKFKNIYIHIYLTVLNVCYFNYMLLNQIHTHRFNINVICHELICLENIKVIVFWHDVVISSHEVYQVFLSFSTVS